MWCAVALACGVAFGLPVALAFGSCAGVAFVRVCGVFWLRLGRALVNTAFVFKRRWDAKLLTLCAFRLARPLKIAEASSEALFVGTFHPSRAGT